MDTSLQAVVPVGKVEEKGSMIGSPLLAAAQNVAKQRGAEGTQALAGELVAELAASFNTDLQMGGVGEVFLAPIPLLVD